MQFIQRVVKKIKVPKKDFKVNPSRHKCLSERKTWEEQVQRKGEGLEKIVRHKTERIGKRNPDAQRKIVNQNSENK